MVQSEKRWLNPEGLEEELVITTSTQAKMRMKKMIPYSKVGKFIRYDRLKINEWLEKHDITGFVNESKF